MYLVLDVDPMKGRLWWDWVKRVRGVEIAQVLRAWKGAGVKGVVWDHAAFHKAKAVGEVGLRRVYQPPYSPELNPAERVFEEVRRWVEGRRYESIEAKKAAVEEVPRRLKAEGKVSSLVALYPSSFECPAFMMKKLCLEKWYYLADGIQKQE